MTTEETLCNITWEVERIKMACKLSQLNSSRSAQYLKATKNPMVWTHYHETQVTSLQISLRFYLSIFFSACHGNQSSCSLECWRSSVIKRAMVRRMFIWGGIVKKRNRVVLECNYWLCILLSSPKLFLPPTIKDCMIRSVSCINICFIGEGSCIWWKCSCA